MNQLLWDTYRKNATAFVHEWAHERDEKGEAHSCWDAFLKIFNLERRRFARHEGRVKREAMDVRYGLKKPFASEAKRVAYLFGLYATFTKP